MLGYFNTLALHYQLGHVLNYFLLAVNTVQLVRLLTQQRSTSDCDTPNLSCYACRCYRYCVDR